MRIENPFRKVERLKRVKNLPKAARAKSGCRRASF